MSFSLLPHNIGLVDTFIQIVTAQLYKNLNRLCLGVVPVSEARTSGYYELGKINLSCFSVAITRSLTNYL